MVENSNPYETPEIDVSSSVPLADSAATSPSYRLFSPAGVALATFLGSFLAGGIVLAFNYHRLGRRSAVWMTILCGVAATMLMFTIAALLPESFPAMPLVVFQVASMYVIAKQTQARTLSQHRRMRGELASNWGAAGIGALCCIVLGAGIVAAILVEEQSLGTSYSLNQNDDIYYSGDATEKDAKALGRALTDLEYLGDEAGTDVLLSKSADGYTVTFLLIDGAWEDEETVDYYRYLGEALADDRFGRPLVVALSDEWGDVQKTLNVK